MSENITDSITIPQSILWELRYYAEAQRHRETIAIHAQEFYRMKRDMLLSPFLKGLNVPDDEIYNENLETGKLIRAKDFSSE